MTLLVIGHLDSHTEIILTEASAVGCSPWGQAAECERQENLVTENEIKTKHIMNLIWG